MISVLREVRYNGLHGSIYTCYVAIISRKLMTIILAQHPYIKGGSVTEWSEELATNLLAGLPELHGKSPSEVEWFETH